MQKRETMSETGTENNKQAPRNEQELASRQLQIQSKRFYIDVKENKRGRFIKLAEVGVGGRKSRIILSMGAAAEFKKLLIEFIGFNTDLVPSQTSTEDTTKDADADNIAKDVRRADDGLLKSEIISKDRKRYYLDLKANQRGRFLRVSMVMNRGSRAQIAIPAQGLVEFKDHLSELLDQYGTDETETELPESKFFRADNKSFYFDCGSNPRGVFLRISEVIPYRYRSAITVPDKIWDQFCKTMNEFIDKVGSEKEKTTDAVTAPAAAAVIKTETKTSTDVVQQKPSENAATKTAIPTTA